MLHKSQNFSRHKELLEPKVRSSIDGLPFITEDYEQAKNILKMKFRKENKIVHAYVSSSMSLLVIGRENPNKLLTVLHLNLIAYAHLFKLR